MRHPIDIMAILHHKSLVLIDLSKWTQEEDFALII